MWSEIAPAASIGKNATAQKTVQASDGYFTLYDTTTGQIIARNGDTPADWADESYTLPFAAVTESYTIAGDNEYILTTDGELYSSSHPSSADSWSSTGVTWEALIGAYNDRVLGIVKDGEDYRHDEYPCPEGFTPSLLESGFPVAGFSQLVNTSSDWSVSSQAIMAGGILPDGSLSANVWGYDGNDWGLLSNELTAYRLPAIAHTTLVPYHRFSVSATTFVATDHIVWLAMGGEMADGERNKTMYMSHDNGITWVTADDAMQLPLDYTALKGAQAFTCTEQYNVAGRKQSPRRIATLPTEWDVPCIYLLGGTLPDGTYNATTLRGVLNRLTFKPVY